MHSFSRKIFLHWLPIMTLPADIQVIVAPLWKSRVIQYHEGTRSLFLQFESRNGINSRTPASVAPSLNHALVRNQLHVASINYLPKHCECATGHSLNLRWHSGQFGELLGIKQQLINAIRANRQVDFL